MKNGIRFDMIVPRPEDQWEQIESLIPEALLTSQYLASLNEELHEEVDEDYQLAIRTAIGREVYHYFSWIDAWAKNWSIWS